MLPFLRIDGSVNTLGLLVVGHLLLLVAKSTPTAGLGMGKSWENSCQRLKTADVLNRLYESDGKGCDGPSYLCSGIFLHGDDASMGASGVDPVTGNSWGIINITDPKNQKMSIGNTCPDVTHAALGQNMGLPFFCPSNRSHAVSYAFIRSDLPSTP